MTPNDVTAAVGRLEAELAACARDEAATHCDPGTYSAEIASADLRLLLQLLREAKEVVGPFAAFAEIWTPTLPENSHPVLIRPVPSDAEEVHLGRRVDVGDFRAAHSLATKLQGVEE